MTVGVIAYFALASPLNPWTNSFCILGSFTHAALMVAAWLVAFQLLRRLLEDRHAWVAVAAGWLWGLSASVLFLLAWVVLGHPEELGPRSREGFVVFVLVGPLWFSAVGSYLTVPLGVVGALAVRRR